MSGIVGVFSRTENRSVDSSAEVQTMLNRMEHRAVNGVGSWADRKIALGFARLDIDRSTPEIPHKDSIRDLTITGDCRIGNRSALVDTLELADKSTPDLLIVLHAYSRWQEKCPHHLEGDFAFAIWDAKNRRLFCARDHFGIKPLYYYPSRDLFAFASEIRPILALEGVKTGISDDSIAGFVAGVPNNPDRTSFTDIRRLPAGHSLLVDAETMAVSRYWQIERRAQTINRDAAEEFRYLFNKAVRKRMPETDTMGVMLSGGLDSSSIACVARTFHREQFASDLPAVSLEFEKGSSMDESQFIDSAIATGGLEKNSARLGNEMPFDQFTSIVNEQEDLCLAPGLATSRLIYDCARRRGLRLLLDGHGGDEVVSHGYGRLHELAHTGHWMTLWREIRGTSKIYGSNPWRDYALYFLNYSRLGNQMKRARRKLSNMNTRLKGHEAHSSRLPWQEFLSSRMITGTNVTEHYRRVMFPGKTERISEAASHLRLLTHPVAQHAFEVLDKTAANFGLEVRYPFWDKALVEFCVSLPAHEKLDNGWPRSVLRKAMNDTLPPDIQWRHSKVDFNPALAGGIRTNSTLFDDAFIGSRSEMIAPYVDLDRIRKTYSEIIENTADVPAGDLHSLFRCFYLVHWLRQSHVKKCLA